MTEHEIRAKLEVWQAADALDRLAVGGDMETTEEQRALIPYMTHAMHPGDRRTVDAILRDFSRLQAQLSAANAERDTLRRELDDNADSAAHVSAYQTTAMANLERALKAEAERDAANDRIAALTSSNADLEHANVDLFCKLAALSAPETGDASPVPDLGKVKEALKTFRPRLNCIIAAIETGNVEAALIWLRSLSEDDAALATLESSDVHVSGIGTGPST